MIQPAKAIEQCDGCGQPLTAPFYYLGDMKCYLCASECIEHEMFSVAFQRGFMRLLEPYLLHAHTANVKLSTIKYLAEEALFAAMIALRITNDKGQ